MRRTHHYNARILMPCPIDAVKTDLHTLLDEAVGPLLERAVSANLTARTAEEGCWEVVVKLGAAMLSHVLGQRCRVETERAVRERGWRFPGDDGDGPIVRLRLDEDYTAQMNSTFGHVAVPLYAVRTPGTGCGMLTPARALFPHRPRLRSSELLLEWECALAADHPFRNAAKALLFFSHGATDVEDTTIERHAVMVGSAIPVDWLYRTPADIRDVLQNKATRDTKTERPIVYASTDAHALKRFVDDKWNPKWKMTNGIRLWCVDASTSQILHLGGEYTWGDCYAVQQIFERLQKSGHLPADGDYGDGVVAQVALLTDGLDWIADYILPMYPTAMLSLDPYHVLQHVAEAATKACPPVRAGSGKKAKTRAAARAKAQAKDIVDHARKVLGVRTKRGRTVYRKGPNRTRHKTRRSGFDGSGQRLLDEVMHPLLESATYGKIRIKAAIKYITKNLYRLDYGDLRTRGFQIGSGAMESLHRTASQVRLKRAGCNWTAEVAQAILNLRMLTLSGRWAEYWSLARPPHLGAL